MTLLQELSQLNETFDKDAAEELKLFIDNDQTLYRQVQSIVKNIQRKMKAGKYDHKLAPKLWMYLIDNGAKAYIKQHGSAGDTMQRMFPKPLRMHVAQQMADEYKDEIEAQGGEMF